MSTRAFIEKCAASVILPHGANTHMNVKWMYLMIPGLESLSGTDVNAICDEENWISLPHADSLTTQC